MDQLIDLVSQKSGISKAQAKTAVETVVNFLKTKLPEPLAGRLDAIFEGADNLDLDKGMDMSTGLFGKK